MTIREAIEKTDLLKPNQYADAEKIRWLSDLDGMIKKEVIDTHEATKEELTLYALENEAGESVPDPNEPRLPGTAFAGYGGAVETALDTTLLIGAPDTDLYVKYLCAQIDFSNAEFQRYNNTSALYNAAYLAFVTRYNRTHLPQQACAVVLR